MASASSGKPSSADSSHEKSETTSKKRTAFDVLMSSPSRSITSPKRRFLPTRNALGDYLHSPSTLPPSVLVTSSPSFVTIRDKFPKASIHLLLLPRDPEINVQHPLTVFSSPSNTAFLEEVKLEVSRLKTAVATELQRKYGGSKQWWAREGNVRVGVHARPSMNHLHVHVMSADMVGLGMKKPKHYLTFNTSFLVGLDEFPLSKDDERWKSGWVEKVLEGDLQCWRCGKSWGRAWKKFREHLEDEAEAWRKEGARSVDVEEEEKGVTGKENREI